MILCGDMLSDVELPMPADDDSTLGTYRAGLEALAVQVRRSVWLVPATAPPPTNLGPASRLIFATPTTSRQATTATTRASARPGCPSCTKPTCAGRGSGDRPDLPPAQAPSASKVYPAARSRTQTFEYQVPGAPWTLQGRVLVLVVSHTE